MISAMCATVSGCLDGTPEYRVPTRVPPVIDTFSVDPLLSRVRPVRALDGSVEFRVPFRSEDLGVPLKYFFVLDYGTPNEAVPFAGDLEADPRPFEEQEGREVAFPWEFAPNNPNLAGCHTVTFILTYIDNVRGLFTPRDPSLAASVTWWLRFDSEGEGVKCPGER